MKVMRVQSNFIAIHFKNHFQISLILLLLWLGNNQEIIASSNSNSISTYFYVFLLWGIFKHCEEYVFSKISFIVFSIERGVNCLIDLSMHSYFSCAKCITLSVGEALTTTVLFTCFNNNSVIYMHLLFFLNLLLKIVCLSKESWIILYCILYFCIPVKLDSNIQGGIWLQIKTCTFSIASICKLDDTIHIIVHLISKI